MNNSSPLEFLLSRKSFGRLGHPVPSEAEVMKILSVAATAPDHGRLKPYRFVVLSGDSQNSLADAFEATSKRQNPNLEQQAYDKARMKALAAPMLICLIYSPKESRIPTWEQRVTAACTGFGVTLGCHALGFAAIWKSISLDIGDEVKSALNMSSEEELLGWVNVGTAGGELPQRDEVDLDSLVDLRMP